MNDVTEWWAYKYYIYQNIYLQCYFMASLSNVEVASPDHVFIYSRIYMCMCACGGRHTESETERKQWTNFILKWWRTEYMQVGEFVRVTYESPWTLTCKSCDSSTGDDDHEANALVCPLRYFFPGSRKLY